MKYSEKKYIIHHDEMMYNQKIQLEKQNIFMMGGRNKLQNEVR